MHRRALGALFALLATGLGLVAFFAALEGGRAWVIALTAGALACWIATVSWRTLVRRP
jgi:hypothetical protein